MESRFRYVPATDSYVVARGTIVHEIPAARCREEGGSVYVQTGTELLVFAGPLPPRVREEEASGATPAPAPEPARLDLPAAVDAATLPAPAPLPPASRAARRAPLTAPEPPAPKRRGRPPKAR